MILPSIHSQIDELFQKDSRAWLKILAGTLVSGYIGLRAVLSEQVRDDPKPSLLFSVVAVIVTAAVGATAVLAFCLRDIVRQQLEDGEPVHIVLRAYCAPGLRSLILFFFSLCFIVTILVVAALLLLFS